MNTVLVHRYCIRSLGLSI